MSALPYHKRYHSDALAGMLSLSLEERGAYQTLLDLMYDRGGPLLDNERLLAGYMNVSIRKYRVVRDSLIAAGKILRLDDGRLSNSRFEKETEKSAKTSQKCAENGSNGGKISGEARKKQSKNNDANKANSEADAKPILEARSYNSSKEELLELHEACWRNYPHPASRGGKQTDKFCKLTIEEAKAFLACLPALKAGIAADKARGFDRMPPMFQTFLNQKRWEGFDATQNSRETPEAETSLPAETEAAEKAKALIGRIGAKAYAAWFTTSAGAPVISKNCEGFVIEPDSLFKRDRIAQQFSPALSEVFGKGGWRLAARLKQELAG